MAKWSVALFGHHKPRFYLRERKSGLLVTDFVEKPEEAFWDEEKYYLYDVHGWERRAEAGDIIAVKPFKDHKTWTDNERKQFLIVTLDDFELEQLAGVTEPYWDTSTYPEITEEILEKSVKLLETLEIPTPAQYHKKRRFNIPLNDLQDMGVDLTKMLDKKVFYSPELDIIKKTGCFDKMKKEKAKDTDGFNLIEPKKYMRVK